MDIFFLKEGLIIDFVNLASKSAAVTVPENLIPEECVFLLNRVILKDETFFLMRIKEEAELTKRFHNLERRRGFRNN